MKAEESARQITKHENYSFRVLTPQYKQQALHLVARSFYQMNPMLLEAAKRKDLPQGFKTDYEINLKFWGADIDQYCSNGLSVIILDESNKGQLVGATLTKDFSLASQEYLEVMHGHNYYNPVLAMASKQIEKVSPEIKQILQQKGKTVDVYGVAIKGEHCGKRLLSRMIDVSCLLAKEKHFQYAFCFAVNARTGAGCKRSGFQQIGQYDCKEQEYQGIKLFSQIAEEEKWSNIWFKKLA